MGSRVTALGDELRGSGPTVGLRPRPGEYQSSPDRSSAGATAPCEITASSSSTAWRPEAKTGFTAALTEALQPWSRRPAQTRHWRYGLVAPVAIGEEAYDVSLGT